MIPYLVLNNVDRYNIQIRRVSTIIYSFLNKMVKSHQLH